MRHATDDAGRDGDADVRILSTQNSILDLIAKRSSFQEILNKLCLLVELHSEGARCSIVLVDKARRYLRAAAGPNMSTEYMASLDGLPIAENVGSCGTAVFRQEPVISTDVAHAPEWTGFLDVAASFDMQSCWSTPFFSSTDQILGSFAIVHSHPCTPTPFDDQLMQTASYLAGIATENELFAMELVKDQKLESVGVLAGGIAHDFNNLLTAIMGNIELAALRVAPESEVHTLLSSARTASIRAREITQRLLTFASGGVPVTAAESVRQIVRETVDFTLAGSNVRCEMSFDDSVPAVESDKGQITQVLQNVLVNAVHAMPGGGVVSIRGETATGCGPRTVPGRSQACVRVSISDDGIGIPEDDLRRVFDPFFSTKGDGHGLGLATSHSIMRRHGGWIDVQSSLGSGTTFYLYFPVSAGEPRSAESTIELTSDTGGFVLVMDDESSVRDMLGAMLTAIGYRVALARDGGEAVALFQARRAEGRPFDLVLLDLTVRDGMGGADALKRLGEIDADVRAVAMSGYSNSPILADCEAHGFVGRLEKPFLVNELRALLVDVIPGTRAAVPTEGPAPGT